MCCQKQNRNQGLSCHAFQEGKTSRSQNRKFSGDVISGVAGYLSLRNVFRYQQCLFFSLAGYVEDAIFKTNLTFGELPEEGPPEESILFYREEDYHRQLADFHISIQDSDKWSILHLFVNKSIVYFYWFIKALILHPIGVVPLPSLPHCFNQFLGTGEKNEWLSMETRESWQACHNTTVEMFGYLEGNGVWGQ